MQEKKNPVRYVKILLIASGFKRDNLEFTRVTVHYCQGTGGVNKNIVEEFR